MCQDVTCGIVCNYSAARICGRLSDDHHVYFAGWQAIFSIIGAPACNMSLAAQNLVFRLSFRGATGDTAVMPQTRRDMSDAGTGILTALRTDILSLVLRPGQKLTTEFLTVRYGLGPTPLREALSLLVGEGLLVRESGRGFRVSPMSRRDLDDLIASRLLIEPALLARAIETGDSAWEADIVRALKTLQPDLQKVGDSRPLDRAWEENHRRFHFALMASGNPSLLAVFCKVLYDRYDRYRLLGIPRRAYLAGVAGDHQDMANAAIARKADLAVAILRRHISDTSNAVLANIDAAGLVAVDGTIEVPPTGIEFA